MEIPKNLSAKERSFCEWMPVVDFNGSEAVRKAKYKTKTPDVQAARLLKKPEINAYIQWLKAERSKKTGIDAEYVLKRLVEIDQMNVLDIHNDDGSLKPLREWPKVWRQFISGMDVAELVDGKGDDRAIIGVMKKIKWPDKMKNLELLGKHVTIGAFKDKVEHSGHVTHEEMLEQLK